MTASENSIAWPADITVRDLIQRFPLPIALLDDVGGVVVMNNRFEQTCGPETLDSAVLQDLIREPAPDWKTVQLPGRGQNQTETNALILRIQSNLMLILNDAADSGLFRKLDKLQVQITELERLSSTDLLTEAWNRAHFDRVVASELDRSIRFKQPVSLIFLDIDHFKQINDAYGHQTGDSVLRELVQEINAAIRSTDMLFRWGGEEFVVIATSTGYRACATLAEKIREKVERHRFSGVGSVTISMGVAEYITSESLDIWFGRVDKALYRAKNGGRNCVYTDQHGSSDLWAAESGLSVIRLIWQEAYECGEPTIDREHRELFDLANSLFDAYFKPESSPKAFKVALEKFMAHIKHHFTDEELLLAQYGYKDLESHRRDHARLLARAEELKASIAAGKTAFGDLVEFLANTVVAQHLFKADRKYFYLFKKQTV